MIRNKGKKEKNSKKNKTKREEKMNKSICPFQKKNDAYPLHTEIEGAKVFARKKDTNPKTYTKLSISLPWRNGYQ